MLLALVPSFGSGSRRQHNWRPALPPHDIRCSTVCGWCISDVANLRWQQVDKVSPRAMTVGGRGMVTTFRHRLPHQRRHRSLPQRLVAMPGASQRLCRVPSDLLTLTVRFDSLSPRRLPHIVQKVSVRCGRLCGCDEARAKRTMRVFHVPSSAAVGLGAQRGTFAAMPVCTTPLSSRDKPHSIVIRMARRP